MATLRISAWGVGEAATRMVVPARSPPDSAVAAACEEAAVEEEAEEPQAARLRASVPARIAEISFFMMVDLLLSVMYVI